MPLRDFPNDALGNEDVIDFLSSEELKELHKLNEMRRSLAAVGDYLNDQESIIFKTARGRAPEGGEANEAD